MAQRTENASSRAFTNRLNTFCSSEENLKIDEENRNNFGTLNAGSPGSQLIQDSGVDSFLNYSK